MLGFYFSPYGRIHRKDFWLKYLLVYFVLALVSPLIDAYQFPDVIVWRDTGPVSTAVDAVALWPGIAVTSKRFHDRGMSGWWQLPFNICIGLGTLFAVSVLLEADAAGGMEPRLWTPLLVAAGLVTVFGIGELIILGFLRGAKGRNKYGDDPLGQGSTRAEQPQG